MRYRSLILCLTMLSSPALAKEDLTYGPPGAWVVPQAVPAAPAAEEAPVTLLLFDTQARLEPSTVTSYSHIALRINNAQGLEAGQVVNVWDPAFDTVTVHRLVIRRGGKVIDVLGTGQKFTILRREKNLEQQTLTGQLTATLQPEGLQVGDIVESETSVARSDPTMKGHMELAGELSFPMRVEQAQIRVVTPASARLRERSVGMVKPVVVTKGGERAVTWASSGVTPEIRPAFAPDRFATARRVEFTDFQSWGDLAALFVPLFDKASTLAPDSALRPEVARIKAATADPAQRAMLALRLVQDKVRYVNLALGVGGLVPAAADESWQRRFGDCKAKTALLIALLRELGIEGVPVLVHTDNGDGMDSRLPMVSEFNHVLVRASIGGKTYWLDGTRSGDIDLATLRTPYYRWGLPVVQGAALVRVQPTPLDRPEIETVIRTDASAGAGQPVPTTLDMVMRGDSAIATNQLLTAIEANVREEALRKLVGGSLDRFEVGRVSSAYDAAKQELRIHGEGKQTLDLDRGVYWTEVPTPGYKADFRRTGTRDNDAPVEIAYPSYRRTLQTIIVPKDRAGRTTFQVDPVSATVAGVEYRRKVTNTDGVVTVDMTSRSLVPEIPYTEAVAAEPKLRELNKDHIWIRFSDSSPVDAATAKELIGRDAKTGDDYYQAAMKLLQDNRPSEALGAIDKAIELTPAKSEYRSVRAQLRMGNGDLAGAEQDALSAVKSLPKSIGARSTLAAIYWKQEKPEAALAQINALETADSAAAQLTRGHLLLNVGRPVEALAAYDKALTFDKDAMTHVYRANALPAADKAGRAREIDTAMKLNPTDAYALMGLGKIASQLGDHDRAMTLFDQAFLKSPDDVAIRSRRAVEMSLAGKTDAAKKEFDALLAKNLSPLELNNMCWDKALANTALDRALDECDRSLAKNDFGPTHDSKGMVLLRQAKFDLAIAEFDLALKNGEMPASLYGRGLAFARKGEKAKADADFARARKLEPGIERTYAYSGLTR